MKKELNAILLNFADVEQNLTKITAKYQREVNNFDEYKTRKRKKSKALKKKMNKLKNKLNKRPAMLFVENVELSFKSKRSSKFSNSLIFIDNKEPDIDE